MERVSVKTLEPLGNWFLSLFVQSTLKHLSKHSAESDSPNNQTETFSPDTLWDCFLRSRINI